MHCPTALLQLIITCLIESKGTAWKAEFDRVDGKVFSDPKEGPDIEKDQRTRFFVMSAVANLINILRSEFTSLES